MCSLRIKEYDLNTDAGGKEGKVLRAYQLIPNAAQSGESTDNRSSPQQEEEKNQRTFIKLILLGEPLEQKLQASCQKKTWE